MDSGAIRCYLWRSFDAASKRSHSAWNALTLLWRDRPFLGWLLVAGLMLAVRDGQALLATTAIWSIVAALTIATAWGDASIGVVRFFGRHARGISSSNVAWVSGWVAAAMRPACILMRAALRCLALPRLRAMTRKATALPPAHIGHRMIAHPCLLRRVVPAPIARA